QLSAALRGYDEYRNDVFISSGITTEFPLQLLVAPVIPINEKAVSRYTVPNLPSKNVQAIFQDGEGWMWFGTDKGIARFNGAEFKSSAVSGSAFEQLAGEDVRSIAEDRNGTMWIATARSVRRITKTGEDAGPVFQFQDSKQVFVDSNGTVWIAGPNGISRFDGKGFLPLAHAQDLAIDDVRGIAEDTSHSIWIATAGGLRTVEGDKVMSFSEWREAHGSPDPRDRQRISDIKDISADRRGRIWITTDSELLFVDGGTLQKPAVDGKA